jgi:methionyl-tRNA synthetase
MAGRKILICVAWPYVNGEKHIGQIAGAYLPPDTFARYQRMKGNDVLVVGGSDTHGTPIMLKAEAEGISPEEVMAKYHTLFIEGLLAMGLSYDWYTHTDTEIHWEVTQQMFLRHWKTGYIYKDIQKQLYDPQANRFLADRYVEGTCPICGYEGARGDQCDNCGNLFDALELKNPRSKITGNTDLEVRETEHFFLDMGKMNQPLLDFYNQGDKGHWRANVINFTRGQLELRELRGRAITRDLDWGIPIPVGDYPTKRIYVWYDAVIGYLSATIEWAKVNSQQSAADVEAWKTWWDAQIAKDARSYYFIGKDNIPFHTIIWPGMLIGYNAGATQLNMPYDVPANEYLNLGGGKFSTSRGNVIGFNTILRHFQPDAVRYVLTALSPESSDVEFTWQDFIDRVNNELVANWGNLVNRMLGFAYKRFEGRVPDPGTLAPEDVAFLDEIRAGFASAGALYEAVKFKAALQEARRLSQRVNQYLNDKAPWKLIATDPAAAAQAVYVALQAIDWLSVIWSPILPFSSEEVHTMLGYDGTLYGRQYAENVVDARGTHLVLRYDGSTATGGWTAGILPPGQALREPHALFAKLDEESLAPFVTPA